MNSYQKEQYDAFYLVQKYFFENSEKEQNRLKNIIEEYLLFRKQAKRFLSSHFAAVCTEKCFQSRLSACCSREGIVTFFADVVVNVISSTKNDIDNILSVLRRQDKGFKCVYLGRDGCLWKIKPIVCEMFLCDQAKNKIFEKNEKARQNWEKIELKKKRFTWPDRPVLYDFLETYFIQKGLKSPLMYMHNSPGLLHVKKQAKRQLQ